MEDQRNWRDRIVVGVDGSPSADAAVRWADWEASSRGCGLTLLATVSPALATTGFGPGIPPSLDLIDTLQEQAQAVLDAAAAKVTTPDVRTHVEVGSASGALIEASQLAEMIVMGSRGRGGFKGLLLGSVGAQVAAHADCPVAIIRDAPRTHAKSIVVGVDESQAAGAAVAEAFAMADRHNLELIAVHAWDIPAYDLIILPNSTIPIPLADVADDEIRLAAEVLAGFRTEFPNVVVQERLVRSSAAEALLNASSEAAMIVVGTRGHGPTIGALLGSVSNAVLHKSNIPVVVVPHIEIDRSAA
jgi:nucleotide-binding universal stress UspA family protein